MNNNVININQINYKENSEIYKKIEKQLDDECIKYYKKLNILQEQSKKIDLQNQDYARIYYTINHKKIVDCNIDNLFNDNQFYEYYKIKNKLLSDIKNIKLQIFNYKKEKLNNIFEWFNF